MAHLTVSKCDVRDCGKQVVWQVVLEDHPACAGQVALGRYTRSDDQVTYQRSNACDGDCGGPNMLQTAIQHERVSNKEVECAYVYTWVGKDLACGGQGMCIKEL